MLMAKPFLKDPTIKVFLIDYKGEIKFVRSTPQQASSRVSKETSNSPKEKNSDNC